MLLRPDPVLPPVNQTIRRPPWLTIRHSRRLFLWCPLCANMASSIRPEVHDISQRRQRRTELRPYMNNKQFWRRCVSPSAFLWLLLTCFVVRFLLILSVCLYVFVCLCMGHVAWFNWNKTMMIYARRQTNTPTHRPAHHKLRSPAGGKVIIIRPHRIRLDIGLPPTPSSVVRIRVGHCREPCNNDWYAIEPVWGILAWTQGTIIIWESRSPPL